MTIDRPYSKKTWIVLVVMVATGIAALVLIREAGKQVDPVYKGKRLSLLLPALGLDGFESNFDKAGYDNAVEAVRTLGTNSIPLFLHLLQQPPSRVKMRLNRLLDKQPLIKFCIGPDPDYPALAAKAFEVLGPSGRSAIPELIGLLGDRDSDEGRQVAMVLGKMAPASVPALLNALTNENKWIWIHAADGIGCCIPRRKMYGKVAIPALKKRLNDSDCEVQLAAARALSTQVGVDFEELVAPLIRCLREGDSQVRSVAAYTLEMLAPSAKTAVPGLIEALKDSNPQVRSAAAGILGKLAPSAKVAVPDLIQALKDSEAEVRKEVGYALYRLDPKAACAAGIRSWDYYPGAPRISGNTTSRTRLLIVFVTIVASFLGFIVWKQIKSRYSSKSL